MIYRIAEQADWTAAQKTGHFASPDLTTEGFIHFSARSQVQGVSERYYAQRTGLWLLAVDESRLTVPLRWENTTGGTELFPHVYGPVPLEAVVCHAPLAREADGRIHWPAGLCGRSTMQCQICQKATATVHYTQMVDGQLMGKVDLCEACANEKGVNDPASFSLADLLVSLRGSGSAANPQAPP